MTSRSHQGSRILRASDPYNKLLCRAQRNALENDPASRKFPVVLRMRMESNIAQFQGLLESWGRSGWTNGGGQEAQPDSAAQSSRSNEVEGH